MLGECLCAYGLPVPLQAWKHHTLIEFPRDWRRMAWWVRLFHPLVPSNLEATHFMFQNSLDWVLDIVSNAVITGCLLFASFSFAIGSCHHRMWGEVNILRILFSRNYKMVIWAGTSLSMLDLGSTIFFPTATIVFDVESLDTLLLCVFVCIL